MNKPSTFQPPSLFLATVLTVVPLIVSIFYYAALLSRMAEIDTFWEFLQLFTRNGFDDWFSAIFHNYLTMVFLWLIAFAYFAVIVLRNPDLDGGLRMGWIAMLFVGGVLANIIYLFVYVMPQNDPKRSRR